MNWEVFGSRLRPAARAFAIILCCLAVTACQFVHADPVPYSQDDLNHINQQGAWNDPNFCGNAAQVDTSTAVSVSTSAAQTSNAQAIIGIAKTDGVGQAGALIGLMVGITESGLRNLANTNVPVSLSNPAAQGTGHDHDSVGVFQQRPSTDWSTIAGGSAADSNQAAVWQLMNPAYAAEAFFGSPPGSNAPPALSKGLMNHPNWQTVQPWAAAQAVQASGTPDGSNYKAQMAKAQGILDANWNTSPPVALPVALSGGNSSGGSGNTSNNPNSGGNGACGGDLATINCSPAASTNSSSGAGNSTGTTSPQSSASAPSGPSGQSNSGTTNTLREKVACLARYEYSRWQSGQLKPGVGGFGKYSENRDELWCADFVSWVYNQAGYPLRATGNWNVSLVVDIQTLGQQGSRFVWHPVNSNYAPQPGDIAIHLNGVSHTNIVTAVGGGTISLLGGDQINPALGDKTTYPDESVVSEYPDTISKSADYQTISGYVSPTGGS